MSAFNQDVKLAAEAIWKVLLASVILGAGLPAIFALGIRSLAWSSKGGVLVADGGESRGGNPAGKVIAAVLFLVIAYAIAAALVFIIASGQGKDISFSHVIPTIKAAS